MYSQQPTVQRHRMVAGMRRKTKALLQLSLACTTRSGWNNKYHDLFLYSSEADNSQRVEIAKVHLPTGFSWDTLYGKKRINDAAVLELKTDVKLSPKVKIRENVSFPRCCLSAFLLGQEGVIMRFEFLQALYASVFLVWEGEPRWEKGDNNRLG